MPRPPVLLLLLAATLSGAAIACGGDGATVTSPSADSSVVRLTVTLGDGVIGTPSSSTPYPKGFTVTYAFNAQPGYQDLRVMLDGSPIPATGAFKIDRPRTLVATATRVAAATTAP